MPVWARIYGMLRIGARLQASTSANHQQERNDGFLRTLLLTMDDPNKFSPDIALFTVEKQHFHHIASGVKEFRGIPRLAIARTAPLDSMDVLKL